jgi:hypothetical protein
MARRDTTCNRGSVPAEIRLEEARSRVELLQGTWHLQAVNRRKVRQGGALSEVRTARGALQDVSAKTPHVGVPEQRRQRSCGAAGVLL